MALGTARAAGQEFTQKAERESVKHGHFLVDRYELDSQDRAVVVGHLLNHDGKPVNDAEQTFFLRDKDRPTGGTYDMSTIEEMSDPSESLKHVYKGGIVKIEAIQSEGGEAYSGSHAVRINPNNPKNNFKISSVVRFISVNETKWRRPRAEGNGFETLSLTDILGEKGLGYDIDNLSGDEIASLAEKTILEKLTPKKRMGNQFRNDINAKAVSKMVMYRPEDGVIYTNIDSLLDGVAKAMTFDQNAVPPRHVLIRVPGDENTLIRLQPTWDNAKQTYIENGEDVVNKDLREGQGVALVEHLKNIMDEGGVVEVIPGAEVNNLQSVARNFITEEIIRLAESKGFKRTKGSVFSDYKPDMLTEAFVGVQKLGDRSGLTVSRVEPVSRPARSFKMHELETPNYRNGALVEPTSKKSPKP